MLARATILQLHQLRKREQQAKNNRANASRNCPRNQDRMKKDLTAFFGKGKRSPGLTTAGNPIEMVIQHQELQVGTLTGMGDSGAGAGGKKDNNNGWCTPLVKKKRDKSNTTPQNAEGKEGQNNKKTRSDNKESAGEQSKGTEQAGPIVDLESMSAFMKKKSPKTQTPK